MVEVEYEGYKYNFYRDKDGAGYWIGASAPRGSVGRYANCRVPTVMWSPLRQKALDDGYTKEDFNPPKPVEKKAASRSYSSKKKKNSISIF